MAEATKRYAVVTGANKGIGYETVRQLASNGIIVVLTARDEKRGLEAVEKLKHSGFDSMIFHQLDVADPATIHSLADFVRSQFGKLDILVLLRYFSIRDFSLHEFKTRCDYRDVEQHGCTDLLYRLNPSFSIGGLLEGSNYRVDNTLSDLPRIVNVSSNMGKLKTVSNEWAKGVFSDAENLTEERVDEVLSQYLNDFKEGSLETKGWPANAAAYILSKAAINAYTRILAKKYPNFCINCVCPGYVKTDMTYNTGKLTAEEGAETPVWLALLPKGGPSGLSVVFHTSSSMAEAAKRYAVVTGANQGIGYEIVRQLASNGVITVLTAIDEKGGLEAVEKLKQSGFDNVIFHQLDVADPAAIHSLADFIRSHFGKLDILVNNAGISGISSDADTLSGFIEEGVARGKMIQTYESAEKCLQTNYLGAKRMCEALIPLLQLSDSARIVNVSSSSGKLKYVTHEWAKGVFSDAENLTEERVDEVLSQYLNDYKEGSPETKGWPANLAAYILSKAAMNAYTRILAKKYPNFCINCVCPGYVKTEMTYNTVVTEANKGIGFEIVRQLASNGVTVALTARDEKRGLAAVEKLKNSGCDNVIFHLLDVTDPASVDSLVHFVSSQFGKLDILVNNAGIGGFNMEGLSVVFHTSSSMAEAAKRYAVVTGANKGIGYEIVRQLASNGVITVLTARDEKGGLEAVEKLKQSGFDNVIFHQLDVADPAAIHSLADFIRSHFGKLDILVNNAGITGISSDADTLSGFIEEGVARGKMIQTYESAEKCLQTNYLGAKRMCEALIPLLQLSDSARIVNVSSSSGKLKYVTHEWAKGVFSDAENLTEERVDEVLSQYLNDYKEGSPETKGWPANLAAYILSKAAMNAYTRILAKKYPNFCINCVCPGYVKTEMTYNTGRLTVEEGAESPVWLALLHKGGPSGLFFSRKEETLF
ncbi:hypothetical protein WN944_017591 [Citrus x changshan-huyou]|uniref:Uncharacterized protein n=1 Tax=Citrus x changshan-huyou TaxID=2935761 RepID=A0AAP0MBJ1_9ROSI